MVLLLQMIILIGVVMCIVPAFSGNQESNIQQPLGYLKQSKKLQGQLQLSHTKILDLILGEYNFEDLMNKFGKAKIFSISTGEEAPSAVCYTSSNPLDDTIIIFIAGPLGGWEKPSSFIIGTKNVLPSISDWMGRSASVIEKRAKSVLSSILPYCTKTPKISKVITTASGITLGITKNQLNDLLGNQPNYIFDESIFAYRYYDVVKMTETQIERMKKYWPKVEEDPHYEVASGIEVRFSEQKLAWFLVYRMESY